MATVPFSHHYRNIKRDAKPGLWYSSTLKLKFIDVCQLYYFIHVDAFSLVISLLGRTRFFLTGSWLETTHRLTGKEVSTLHTNLDQASLIQTGRIQFPVFWIDLLPTAWSADNRDLKLLLI